MAMSRMGISRMGMGKKGVAVGDYHPAARLDSAYPWRSAHLTAI